MTQHVTTDELWHDLIDSVTTRHLLDEITIRDLLESMNSAEQYIAAKLEGFSALEHVGAGYKAGGNPMLGPDVTVYMEIDS